MSRFFFFNLRALTLQLVFRLNQLVFLRKPGVDFGKLRLNPIDFRNILHPVHAPVLHRRALQPCVRVQQNRLARCCVQLTGGELRRIFRAVDGDALFVHNLRGNSGFGKEIAVMVVGWQQPHLQAALPERRKRQAAAFRYLVERVDVSKTQRAQRKSAQKYTEWHPCISPAFRHAALAIDNSPGCQQQNDNPRHGEIVHPAVNIVG